MASMWVSNLASRAASGVGIPWCLAQSTWHSFSVRRRRDITWRFRHNCWNCWLWFDVWRLRADAEGLKCFVCTSVALVQEMNFCFHFTCSWVINVTGKLIFSTQLVYFWTEMCILLVFLSQSWLSFFISVCISWFDTFLLSAAHSDGF